MDTAKEPDPMQATTTSIDDETLYMEKLLCLRGLRDQQHSLQSLRGQLEGCYDDYKKCRELSGRCGAELEKLKGERSRLQNRLSQTDADMKKLSMTQSELEGESKKYLSSAPTVEYSRLEVLVSEQRKALGMEQLSECQAYSQLKLITESQTPSSSRKVQRQHSRSSVDCKVGKAGPSHKQCACCNYVVPRNSIICPSCKSPCSRPGHRNGKKKR